MSTEAECSTERDCRRAETLAVVLQRGAEFLRVAHREYGHHPDIKPAVERLLNDQVDETARRARGLKGFRVTEQFHVQIAEHRTAVRQAMAILFPPEEE